MSKHTGCSVATTVDNRYDGDRVSTHFVFAEDAVAEIDAKLNSVENYVDASGSLANGSNIETIERVLRSFTGFK